MYNVFLRQSKARAKLLIQFRSNFFQLFLLSYFENWAMDPYLEPNLKIRAWEQFKLLNGNIGNESSDLSIIHFLQTI